MAKVWMDGRCPACGELVEGEGVLVARVKTTAEHARETGSRHNIPWKLARRFLFPFPPKSRKVYHPECASADLRRELS